MTLYFIEPDSSGNITNEQVLNNINLMLNEVELMNSNMVSLRDFPVYRTIRQFELQKFFILFGLKETTLYKLSKSKHASQLPSVIVIHCNSFREKKVTAPKIIEDKLFISQEYFKAWISSPDSEVFERRLLDLVLNQLSIANYYQN